MQQGTSLDMLHVSCVEPSPRGGRYCLFLQAQAVQAQELSAEFYQHQPTHDGKSWVQLFRHLPMPWPPARKVEVKHTRRS
jgi:hypothetical protein